VRDNSLTSLNFIEPPYLLAVGLVLLGVFVAIGSNLGLQAPVLVIGLVWALHLSVGLAAIRATVIALSRWRVATRWPDLVVVLMAGLVASVVLAPVSFMIDQGLFLLGVDTDDEMLTRSERWFPLTAGLLEEWTHVVGPTLLVAVMLGLPAWWVRRQVMPNPTLRIQPAAPAVPASDSETESPRNNKGRSCLQRLPAALGTDLIAARSELQYVRIYTTKGNALVLGALKDIAEHRKSEGQLVHRTWWISNRHVRTLRPRGTRYVLTLANELEVPVSRRRQQEMIRQFGSSTTLDQT
jgi:hypothetical protein